MTYAISMMDVSKRYRLGLGRGDLRGLISSVPHSLIHRFHDGKQSEDDLWAIKNISFEVAQGEVIGIVGSNGAGKTTILKLLSRVTKPTIGNVDIKGRISALIELGAGFHPELTGRENIYLNAAILGLSKKEVDSLFERIVEFSGLARFLDTPVKRYSSGMQVRLGFAVAAHIDPDILLIDEVLAVGDLAFRRRCFERIGQLVTGGRTVVIVSHDMLALRNLCSRGLWIRNGTLEFDGDVSEAVIMHEDDSAQQPLHTRPRKGDRRGTGDLLVTSVDFVGIDEMGTHELYPHQSLGVRLNYQVNRTVNGAVFWLCITDPDGMKLVGSTLHSDEVGLRLFCGSRGSIICHFDDLPLPPGSYALIAGIMLPGTTTPFDRWGRAASFTIKSAKSEDRGNESFDARLHGLFKAQTYWQLDEVGNAVSS